eukprot:gene3120-3417_t
MVLITTNKNKLFYTLLGGAAICSYILYSLIRTSLSHQEDGRSYWPKTAIIILGGGLLPDGSLPPHTLLRVERAVEIYQQLEGRVVIIPLSGGTPHKPNPLDPQGFVIWESSAAAKKLLALGIPAEKVLEENFSLDTIGNAYFLRMIHVENCEFEKLIIITNDWHMSRTRAIFDTVFHLPMRSSSLQVTSHSSLHLTYETVPAGVSDQSILAARIAREQQSLITFNEKTRTLWKSMQDLHHWLFVEHNAYASKRLLPKKEDQQKDVNTLALSTY